MSRQGVKTTANIPPNDQSRREPALSRPVITNPRRDRDNEFEPITYRVTQAPASADVRERKRSALVGVQYAKQGHEDALRRLEDERQRYANAIIAARDQGATVQECAQQAGVSRNALYELFRRINRKAK